MALDIGALSAALDDAFDLPGFTALLQTIGKKWDTFAGLGTTLVDGITNVIAKAEAQGWTPKLLKAVAESPSNNNPLIVAFFAANPEYDPARAPAAPPDPFVSKLLVANRPFIGRDPLRKSVPFLGRQANSRILLVDGGPGSGKTYTNDFLQYMAIYHPCRVAYLDLDSESFGLERLAARLGELLGIEAAMPEQDKEQDSRWAERLAEWLIKGSANGDGHSVWLVLDGFATREHEPGAHELIAKLGEQADSTAAGASTHFRLVLINYGSRMPETVAAGAFEERIDPPKPAEFKTVFIDLCTAKGRTETEAETAFDEVFTQAQAKAAADPRGAGSLLKWLNLGVTRAVKRL